MTTHDSTNLLTSSSGDLRSGPGHTTDHAGVHRGAGDGATGAPRAGVPIDPNGTAYDLPRFDRHGSVFSGNL